MEIRNAKEVLLGIGASATAMGALALASCGGHQSAEAKGAVECTSGRQVEGVWIDTDSGKSGFAEWAAERDKGNIATYKFKLGKAGKFSIHVGCGGSPSDWASSTWSEEVDSGESHNFVCHDSPSRPSSEPLLACDEVSEIPKQASSEPYAPGHSYEEIVQFSSGSKTFQDYKHFSGEGPTLRQYETVEVDCLVTDPQEVSDSTRGKWYHLVGPKAVRGLFSPSNTFENGINNPNRGPAADPRVPDCP